MKKLVFALIASAAVAGAAQAQTTTTTTDAPRGYVGLGVATADHDYSLSGVTDKDGYKASAKVFGGYEFNKTFGVEAGYTDFGKSDFSFSNASGTGNGRSDGHAAYIAGKATAPLNDQFAVYGKLGVENSHRFYNTTTGLSGSSNDTGVYGAVGLQYNLTKEVSLTAEYERYGKSKDFGAKADVWTVGARYNF
ncbi:outer membrane beta-barrel protein [Massilia agilis]|uniref:Outer membrane beta-barrel protein n=1 Tax=Massilia agilis TaxID=1811226 RepID=A0ABT2DCQ6_9BURK|nr:outer membrane beta-barrel protein [Massilia agilis]MCS0809062.1 outer membrane beta-barrel protein [Massilia agilis]